MSVLEKDRHDSETEFLNTAYELEKYTYKQAMNEKIIPKRYRFTLGKSLIEATEKICKNVIYANSIFPNPKSDEFKEEIELRKRYQKIATREIYNFLHLVRLVSELFPSISCATLEEWTRMATKEERLLKGWIRSDRDRYRSRNA